MSYRPSRFPGSRRVLAQDAVHRYDLRRTLMARMLTEQPALSLLLLHGDVEMEELDLDPRAGTAFPTPGMGRAEADIHGLIIAGNLLVGGPIHHVRAPIGLSLYVLGSLRATNVLISGLELVVRGSVHVDEVFCGSGPAGGARLDGGVAAKLLISDGFPMLIGGRLAAPVLDTGQTRIGIVEGTGVREAHGDVPGEVVLSDAARDPRGRFSFAAAQEALAARRAILSADHLAGRANLTAIRELRWLEGEIDAALNQRRYLRAVELLRAARERGAPRLVTGLQLADALYHVHRQSGDREGLQDALELLDECLGAEPDATIIAAYPEALVQRATILLQLHELDDGAFEMAWRDLTRAAVTLPPHRRPEIAALMGHWLFLRRQYADCVPYLRQALQADDLDGVTHGRLARALWMLDREGEAVPHATRSLELNPTDDRMWYVRGKCLQVLGDIGRARLDLQTYLELHPDDELAVEALIEIGLDQGHAELAVQRARRFLAVYPNENAAAARFGRLLHSRGFHEAAIPFLHRAMLAQRDDATVVVDLALALSERPGKAQGLDTALRSYEIDPGGGHLSYLRGECLLALGDLPGAEAELAAYLGRHGDAARAQASLAAVLLATGRTEDASRRLEVAAEAAPYDEYVEAVAARAGMT